MSRTSLRARGKRKYLAVGVIVAGAIFGDGGSLAVAEPAPSAAMTSALTALSTADYPRAERELAAIKGADQGAAQIALARVYFETGRYDDASTTLGKVTADAKKIAVANLRAEIMTATGKRKDAIALLSPYKTASGADARRAKVILGQLLIDTGHRADADDPLHKVIDEYNSGSLASSDAEGLAIAGRAAFLLRSPKDANTLFNESERVDKKRVETLTWRADLFLDKYDPGHAGEVLKEALEVAPKRADLLVAMARVKLDDALDFDGAEKLVAQALAVNPKQTGAFAVRAGLALRDMDIGLADKAVADGLAIDPENLELLSIKAAVRFLADDRPGYENAKRDVLAKNPEFSGFFSIVSTYAEWEHRYDDIVAMMKEATKIDPEDGKAWADLGLNEARNGDETAGLDALKKAWSKDHFNVRVFNTLNLYEQTIANQYDMQQEGVFKIRYPKDEEAVLVRYVPQMLSEAFASMKSRYGFVPTTPVQVELYGGREPFSVRTSGLPNIGIQGVCFGRLIAAMSPKSEPFNWGNVLWHELGHVFAIQLSKNHVPRWFTEGLSEYETIARRPEWARELDPQLYLAITQNRLPKAVDMNRAFTHADSAEDVTVAYYAASQMLVFTAETFGMPKITEALRAWGEGVRTPEVLQRAFGVSADDYDAKYRAWQLARLERYKGQFIFAERGKSLEDATAAAATAPNDAKAHVDLAVALLRSKKVDDAKKELDHALQIDPKEMSAHFIYAKLLAATKDPSGAERHLQAIRAAGGDGYTVESMLADIAEEKKDKNAMRFALEAAYRWDPSQSDSLKGLYDLAHEDKRDGDALDAIRKLAELEQHDPKIWRVYTTMLDTAKMWDEAKRAGESAVFVDVLSAETHVLYARALSQRGRHDRAAYELETALLCKQKPKDLAQTHASLAAEDVALKNVTDAKKHRDEALKLDPENADAKALKL